MLRKLSEELKERGLLGLPEPSEGAFFSGVCDCTGCRLANANNGKDNKQLRLRRRTVPISIEQFDGQMP